MRSAGFRFKQFHINHDRCAMKVGTDGVLLGAWVDVSSAQQILDLGTGSGLIALMLAQRSVAESQIHAVELDPAAAQQAQENVAASPWAEKVRVYQQDIFTFCQQTPLKFDLIVANPPYFESGIACRNTQRNTARYVTQSHVAWLEAAHSCLTPQGKISFVLPFEAAETLLKSTALSCIARCDVVTKAGKTPQRVLLTFSAQAQQTTYQQLTIYDAQNQYHADFIALTKDFYLAW